MPCRHGQPGRIRISVQRVARQLRIEVIDDGIGFDAAGIDARGLGLASMRDRAAAVRGTLHVISTPGSGTVVRLDVPLTGASAAALAPEPADVASTGAVESGALVR